MRLHAKPPNQRVQKGKLHLVAGSDTDPGSSYDLDNKSHQVSCQEYLFTGTGYTHVQHACDLIP